MLDQTSSLRLESACGISSMLVDRSLSCSERGEEPIPNTGQKPGCTVTFESPGCSPKHPHEALPNDLENVFPA